MFLFMWPGKENASFNLRPCDWGLFDLCRSECLRNIVYSIYSAEYGEQPEADWRRNFKRKEWICISFTGLFLSGSTGKVFNKTGIKDSDNVYNPLWFQVWPCKLTPSRWERFEVFRRRSLTFRIGCETTQASTDKWLIGAKGQLQFWIN